MVNYMAVASELDYLSVPENILIDLDMLDRYPREQIVLVTTGSQGEPMSALSRMAYSDHRKVMVGEVTLLSFLPILFPVTKKQSEMLLMNSSKRAVRSFTNQCMKFMFRDMLVRKNLRLFINL